MSTTFDDRGRPCGILALSRRQFGLRALGLPGLFDSQTKRELALTGKLELACAIGGGAVGCALWQLVWIKVPVLGIIGLCGGFTLVSTIAATITWWLSLGAVRRRSFRRLVEIYLTAGRCASCGYDLAGLAMADDGCVVCPECGAAWRADRIEAGEKGRTVPRTAE